MEYYICALNRKGGRSTTGTDDEHGPEFWFISTLDTSPDRS